MSAKSAKSAASTKAAPTTITSYKGFDLQLRCRDHQFEIGQTYTHDGPVVACKSGYHACEPPLDVLAYYAPGHSRYAVVTQGGNLARHDDDSKIASSVITIKAELTIRGLVAAAIEYTFAHSATSGYGAHSATSGDGAHSATSGYGANSATSGDGAHSATSGYGAHSATSGYGAHSATSGDGAHSATSGYGANSATSGYRARAETSGAHAVAANAGNGPARAGESGAIFLVERNDENEIVAVFASKVGENGIKANTWYALREGKPVEVTP